MHRHFLIQIGILLFTISTTYPTQFTSSCQSLADWEFLDVEGDGNVSVVHDFSVPPGYGPNVIRLSGSNVLLFAKDQRMSNGTIMVLWKDIDPQQHDSDGILLFGANYPDDLVEVHNIKRNLPHFWLEQDFDSGTVLRYRDADDKERDLFEAPAVGLTNDTTWNYVGWFWQKVKIENNTVSVKFWSVIEDEPEQWRFQVQHQSDIVGRFGVRLWSGLAHVAYFEASIEDISIKPPKLYLYTQNTELLANHLPRFRLFTNLTPPTFIGTATIEVDRDDKKVTEIAQKINIESASAVLTVIPLREAMPTTNFLRYEEPTQLSGGTYRLNIRLDDNDNEYQTDRWIHLRSREQLDERLRRLRSQTEALTAEAETLRVNGDRWRHPMTCAQTATAMVNLADERIFNSDEQGAERAMDLADTALQRAERYPHGQLHSGEFRLRIAGVKASSESFIAGHSYNVNVGYSVEGAQIDRDFSFSYSLLDEYGRAVSSFEKIPDIPTSSWKSGIHQQTVTYHIPAQIPPNASGPIEMPIVFAGNYYLAVTVYDKMKGAVGEQHNWLLLDNPEALRFYPVGRYYILKEVYITPHPVHITDIFAPDELTVQDNADIFIQMMNASKESLEQTCYARIISESGAVVHEAVTNLTLIPDEQRTVHLSWVANFVGDLTVEVQLLYNGQMRTLAKRKLTVRLPQEMWVGLARDVHTYSESGRFFTPMLISFRGLSNAQIDHYKITVQNESEQLAEINKFLPQNQDEVEEIVSVKPTWGYYTIRCEFTHGRKKFYYEKRIVGTVVEVHDSEILVNGEPFIVKGVNVHGMWSNSRTLTDRAMKLLKEYGFNTLRGDHPNRWLLKLAHKNNLCFMCLPDFSVAKSADLYRRFDSDPLGGCQEISRQYIIANRDLTALLFWNSANEVVGELDELLVSLYPVYKNYDPYNRPVLYANLYGQDNWRGEDIMGINYYFGWRQHASARQPIIERSIETGLGHHLPVIYTEFNSWWGPVEESGEEAVWDMAQFGLDHGMSGGTLYQFWDARNRHPGLIEEGSSMQVRQVMGEALKQYHADVAVNFVRRDRKKVTLAIRNKRRCTLRQVHLVLQVRGTVFKTLNLNSIHPLETRQTIVWLPQGYDSQTVELTGNIKFETHFGLKNEVSVRMFVK